MSDLIKSRVGLANVGNTCFLNVVLQALRLTPPLCVMFLKDPEDVTPRSDSRRKQFLKAYQILTRDFWRAQTSPGTYPTLVPHGFIHCLHAVLRETEDDWYRPGQQCDAAEALQYILDSLHDSMYRRVHMDIVGSAATKEESSQEKCISSWSSFFSKEYSPIVQNFNGQNQIRVTCSLCDNVTERYEPWLMIKAPIPGADVVGGPAPTMPVCLDSAFAPESLDDYHCDKCNKKVKAIITNKISRIPPIAIVTLKRFTNRGHKVRGRIGWDLDALDFSPWMAFPRDPFNDAHRKNSDTPVYQTYAVIEHHGSANGGHYRMYARQGSEWLSYDDSSVSVAHPDTVISADSYIALMMPKAYASTMNRVFEHCVKTHRGRYDTGVTDKDATPKHDPAGAH
jgi:ubiquitin C-terminal hydrolase